MTVSALTLVVSPFARFCASRSACLRARSSRTYCRNSCNVSVRRAACIRSWRISSSCRARSCSSKLPCGSVIGSSASTAVGILIPATWMYCESIPIVFPATSVVHVGFWRARCSWSMITFSESTMARSRCTATESLCSSSPYRASATCGGLTTCGPMAAELAASALSGLPTVGAGGGVVVSMTGAGAGGRPRPPLGPLPRLVPPNGGNSVRRGGWGGMMVMSDWGRSMRHALVTASVSSAPCSTRLAAHVSRALARGTFRGSNSGQHLSETLRRLAEPRRRDGERDPEKPLTARAEPAPRHGDDAFLFERSALERGRWEALRQGHPQVHRGPRRLGLEPLRPQHRQHRVSPLPELRDILARQLLSLRQHGRARRLHREERTGV